MSTKFKPRFRSYTIYYTYKGGAKIALKVTTISPEKAIEAAQVEVAGVYGCEMLKDFNFSL